MRDGRGGVDGCVAVTELVVVAVGAWWVVVGEL